MGKYDAALTDIPKAPAEDNAYQAKVETVKATLRHLKPTELMAAYIAARAEKERVERELYNTTLSLVALTQLLDDSQEAGAEGWGQYGVSDASLRLVNGDTLRIERKPSGVVQDKEAFRLWCLAHGYEAQMHLWPTRASAVVTERLVAGEELPDGTDVFSKAKIVLTLAKGGGE
jgi:hypothetical protein